MKRRLRLLRLSAALVGAGMVFQFGGCFTGLANTVLSGFDFCSILGPNCTFGPFAPCGDPTTSDDDLLVDCPAPPDTE